MEGLRENRSLTELDVRETQCGDENAHAIQLKISENRRLRKPCDTVGEGDDPLEDEKEKEGDDEEEEDRGEDGEHEDEAARRTSIY